jgi:PAS domain-containing protein
MAGVAVIPQLIQAFLQPTGFELPAVGLGQVLPAAQQEVYDEDGQRIALVGIARDITGRKQAEEALRSSEEKFRQLAENMREMFGMVTLRGMGAGARQVTGQCMQSVFGRHSVSSELEQ